MNTSSSTRNIGGGTWIEVDPESMRWIHSKFGDFGGAVFFFGFLGGEGKLAKSAGIFLFDSI